MSAAGTVPGAVAVVGAGLTGASWAGLFAAHGREVRIHDVDGGRARAAAARAADYARFLVSHGLADPGAAGAGIAALRAEETAAAYADVVLVQECVVEDLSVKRAVFAEADRLTPPAAVLATSSSGLSISRIQAGLPGAARCLAAHPYNPPHLVPLVEVAPGRDTDPAALETARVFYESVGKDPVVLARDIPGYLSNRMSAALWREAVELVRAGVASVSDVDRAIASGPGLRWAVMGPHLLYHLGGGEGGIRGHLDHLGPVKEGMLRDIASWVVFPSDTADVLEAGLEAEIEGRAPAALERERDEALAGFLRVRAAAAAAAEQDPSAQDPSPGGDDLPAPSPLVVGGSAAKGVSAAPGVTRTTLVAGAETTMVRFELEAGAEIPSHHHHHEQTGYLVSGELTLVTESGSWAVRPGDGWSFPGGCAHGAHTGSGAVVVEVFAPPRVDYLPGAPGRDPD